MRKLAALFGFVLLCSCAIVRPPECCPAPSVAEAAEVTPHGFGALPPGDIFDPNMIGVSGALLSSNPNFLIRSRGYGAVTVYVNLTYAAASAIGLKCYGGNYPSYLAPVGVATVGSNGAITMADGSWAYPTGSVSRLFRFIVGPLNDPEFSCTVSGTGATTDTVNVALYGGSE